MSKIADYRIAKQRSVRIAEAVHLSLGEDSTRNDKHKIRWDVAPGNASAFLLDSGYGYYGNSGFSRTDNSSDLRVYIAKALNALGPEIFRRARELALKDAEAARLAAIAEAREVLQEAQS